MAFITLGTASQLQIQIPTKRTTGWSATLQTELFQKLVTHNHAGSGGTGAQIASSAIPTDGVDDTNILMSNDGYLRWRNNADSANLNAIKVDTNDKLTLNLEINAVVKLSNNIALQHRNQADSAYIDTIKVNTSDKIALGADLANAAMINNTYITGRNNADSAYINIVKVNASDKLEIGAQLNNVDIINDTYYTGRNNADSANVDIIKVNTSDKLALGTDLANIALINDTYYTARNNADSGYINLIKANTSDKIAIGADVANFAIINNTYLTSRNNADSGYVNIAKVNTSDQVEIENVLSIDSTGSASLSDNQSATSASIITLASNEAVEIKYKILRGTDVQNGTLEIEQSNATVIDSYTGDDTGVTFSLNSGDLEYATTNTGNGATMTYIIIKK